MFEDVAFPPVIRAIAEYLQDDPEIILGCDLRTKGSEFLVCYGADFNTSGIYANVFLNPDEISVNISNIYGNVHVPMEPPDSFEQLLGYIHVLLALAAAHRA